MAKIVLNTEPTCTRECPFCCDGNCKLSKDATDCKAIKKTPDEYGMMVDTLMFNVEVGEWVLLIDFERCPYCTTFVKEYSFQKELDKEE